MRPTTKRVKSDSFWTQKSRLIEVTDGIDSNVLSRRLGLLWALMFLGPAVLVVGLTQLSQDPVLGIPRVFFAMSALSMALGLSLIHI